MKQLSVIICMMLMAGCISMGNEALNESDGANATPPQQNVTPPANATGQSNQTVLPEPEWERFVMHGFSFDYPTEMVLGAPDGTFFLLNEDGTVTLARLAVASDNVTKVYGANREAIFLANPGKAPADILVDDQQKGKLLPGSYAVGDVSTFSISRGVYAAQVQFKLREDNAMSPSTCYAMDIYMPESSLLVRVRICALDQDRAEEMRIRFLESFQPE